MRLYVVHSTCYNDDMTNATITHIPASDLVDSYGDALTEGSTLFTCTVGEGPNRMKYTFGMIPKGRSGRQVFQGPMVEGPWAWLTAQATVIALHPIAEHREIVSLSPGDQIEVEGQGTFEVVAPKRHEYYPKLTTVEVAS